MVVAKKSIHNGNSKVSENVKKIEDVRETIFEPITHRFYKILFQTPENFNIEKPRTISKLEKNSKPRFFYHIIFADFLIFLCILSVFLGDLANLLNDSGQLEAESLSYLVLTYKNASRILNSCVVLSIIAFFLRYHCGLNHLL